MPPNAGPVNDTGDALVKGDTRVVHRPATFRLRQANTSFSPALNHHVSLGFLNET